MKVTVELETTYLSRLESFIKLIRMWHGQQKQTPTMRVQVSGWTRDVK